MKPIWIDYILCYSNSMTFCKRQNSANNKNISGSQGLGVGKGRNGWISRAQSAFRAVKILVWYRWQIHVIMCCVCSAAKSRPTLWAHGLRPTRLLCPRDSPGKNTSLGCHFLLQGSFSTQESNHVSWIDRQILYHRATWEACVLSYIYPNPSKV